MKNTDAMSPRTVADAEPDVFAQLGAFTTGARSTLSPFRQDAAPPSRSVREKLIKGGLLSAAGEIDGDNVRALNVLNGARRVTSIQLFGAARVFEYYTYFPTDAASPVSVKTFANHVRVEDPAATDDTLAYLGNMIGSSVVIGTEFKTALSPNDALVFAALIDEQRRLVFRTLADGPAPERAITAAAIEEALQRTGGPAISIVALVKSALHESAPEVSTGAALKSLIAAGHVRKKGKGVLLSESAAELAGHLLNIEMVLTLAAAREDDGGQIDHVRLTCGIAGLHDVVTLEYVDGRVLLETVPTRAVLSLAEFYLREPDAMPRRARPTANGRKTKATKAVTEQVRFCGNCGKPRGASDRFCVVCGSPLESAAGHG